MASLERILPLVNNVIGFVVTLLVILDYFIVGGIGVAPANITTVQAIYTRAAPLITIIMVYRLLQLYYRRGRSDDRIMKRKGIIFFIGFAITLSIGLIYGSLSTEYSFVARALVQTVTETGGVWIGIVYGTAIIRGYRFLSIEGIVLSVPGLLELFALSGLGNLFPFLQPIADAGIWVIRYPNIGGNIPVLFASYLATISIAARVLTGRQKLRAAR